VIRIFSGECNFLFKKISLHYIFRKIVEEVLERWPITRNISHESINFEPSHPPFARYLFAAVAIGLAVVATVGV
jgi:hypothetical protein